MGNFRVAREVQDPVKGIFPATGLSMPLGIRKFKASGFSRISEL
jgi:hypothetical protein